LEIYFSNVKSEKVKHFKEKDEIIRYILEKYSEAIIIIKSSNSTGLQSLVGIFKEMRA
jgi:UDP-N-acetylmuramyl pentapeptide synthase